MQAFLKLFLIFFKNNFFVCVFMWLGLPPSTPHPILVLRSPALLKPSTQFIMALRNIDDVVVGNEVIRFTSLIIPRVNGKADVKDNEYNGFQYETIVAETDEGVGCRIKKSLYDRCKAAGLVTTDEWESEIEAEGAECAVVEPVIPDPAIDHRRLRHGGLQRRVRIDQRHQRGKAQVR